MEAEYFHGVQDWNQIDGFSRNEFRPIYDELRNVFAVDYSLGPWWEMHQDLIARMVKIRFWADQEATGRIRIIIHENSGFAISGHSQTSLHGQYQDGLKIPAWEKRIGRAADFTIQEKSEKDGLWRNWPWDRQVLLVWKYTGPGFGVGVYPFWNRPGVHLDYRAGIDGRSSAVWFQTKAGEYRTFPFNEFYRMIDECFKLVRVTEFNGLNNR